MDRNSIARGQYFDGLLYDITAPDFPVSVDVGTGPQGYTIWVNVGPACVLRICRIAALPRATGLGEAGLGEANGNS
jgi:hypothetical protein